MSAATPFYIRRKQFEGFKCIQQLRSKHGDATTAVMLGISIVGLNWKRQSIPVVRLAFIMHHLTFNPSQPITMFDILTLGKYRPTPQGNLRQIKDFSEKISSYHSIDKHIDSIDDYEI